MSTHRDSTIDPASTPPAAPVAAVLQVGRWRVETALDRISAEGKTVKLEAKAMAVLACLARCPGQVVSREALLASVWTGVVVGDDSLTQVVIKLRKALGDDPRNPEYIETIAKRGYRLVAPVVEVEAAALSGSRSRARIGGDPGKGSSPGTGPTEPRPGLVARGSWILLAALAAVIAFAATAWWMAAAEGGVAPTPGAAAVGAVPLVHVRAFEALGDDRQVALLAQGISADLVTDLSRVSGLAVIAASQQGNALSQDSSGYVVSGTVQRFDQRLRVQVSLGDAASGRQLWTERFDRPIADFFAIQDEVGPRILQLLPAKVSEAEQRRVAHRHTRNLEAYQDFQRAQSALVVRSRSENEVAREMFRRAIARDPAFARAYAGLALTHAADYRNQWGTDGAAALERAFELARTAYQMDPGIAETAWVLAFAHVERKQHAEALRYLEDAVRLNPSFADGYALMGGIHTYLGQPARTVPLLRTAMRLAPQPSYLYFLLLGRAYFFLGDLEQARINLGEALSRNPVNLESHVYLAALHVAAGDSGAAAWEMEEIHSLQPGFSAGRWLETGPMADAALKAKLLQALGRLGL